MTSNAIESIQSNAYCDFKKRDDPLHFNLPLCIIAMRSARTSASSLK